MTNLTIPQIAYRISKLNDKIGELSQIQNSDTVTDLQILGEGSIDGTKFSHLIDITDSEAIFRAFLNDYIPSLIAQRTQLEYALRQRTEALI